MATGDGTRSLELEDDLPGAPTSPAEPLARTSDLADVNSGDSLGRYTIRERIGAGGMGVVFAALDPELDRAVAIKVLKRAIGGSSPEARARFQREAQAMARLNHPNAVSVFDVGTIGDRVYVAMELINGPTLAAWLAEKPRGWREIVDVFLQAGRGLAAAHAAGIVHRDFKPSNVIVGDRVRVVDFGLARSARGPDDFPTEAATTALGTAVTVTGQRVGTPAYMAPEQLSTGEATPASDQYSYAVTLHEALWGARPDQTPPGRARPAPGWLRKIVDRGLALRPGDRYPSMNALLADLGHDRSRARERVAASAVLVVLAAGALVFYRAVSPGPCEGGEGEVAGLWDAAAQARVAAAFEKTGRPYAGDTFSRVDATLRTRLARWAQGRREACEATHVKHVQSEALLDLRMQCLGRGRDEFATVIGLLGDVDGSALDRAMSAVSGIADPASCADVVTLGATVPPPHDPEARREDGALRLEAARVRALLQLGRLQESLAASQAASARARKLDDAPALATVLAAAVQVEGMLGNDDDAIKLGYEAVRAAEEAHDDATRADVLGHMVFYLGYDRKRYAEADTISELAESAAARAGHRADLLASLYHGESAALESKGDFAGALTRAVAELGLAVRVAGWRSADVSAALSDIADDERALGQFPAALSAATAAVEVAEAALGPNHPTVATRLFQEGLVAVRTGALEVADRAYSRALAIREAAFGSDHEKVAGILIALGEVRYVAGRMDEAGTLLERATKIHEKLDHVPPDFVSAQELRGAIEVKLGHHAAAEAIMQKAFAAATRAYGPDAMRTAHVEGALGIVQFSAGRLPEAAASLRHALIGQERFMGHSQPQVALIRLQLAEVLRSQGHVRDAVALCDEALPLVEKGLGTAAVGTIEALAICTDALIAAGDLARARQLAERADSQAMAAHLKAETLAAARFRHAEVMAVADHDRARACALALEARTDAASVPYDDELKGIDVFLEKNRCR